MKHWNAALAVWFLLMAATTRSSFAFGIDIREARYTPVQITHVFAYWQNGGNYECLSFKNAATKAITAIHFRFNYLDSQYNLLNVDNNTRRGTFEPGIEVEGPKSEGDIRKSWGFSGKESNCWRYKMPDRMLYLRIEVIDVTYDDGTSWSAPERILYNPSIPHGAATALPATPWASSVTPAPSPTP